MKRLLVLFPLLIPLMTIITCVRRNTSSTWIIEKQNGEKETIVAKNYWIITPDTSFIKFQISDTTSIVYSKDGVASFRKL